MDERIPYEGQDDTGATPDEKAEPPGTPEAPQPPPPLDWSEPVLMPGEFAPAMLPESPEPSPVSEPEPVPILSNPEPIRVENVPPPTYEIDDRPAPPRPVPVNLSSERPRSPERREPPLSLAIDGRPQTRQFLALLIIGVAAFQNLGFTLKTPSMLEANDISRWCTVWSLLERGSYAIDKCPWQYRTQDKVYRSGTLAPPGENASPLKKFEYLIAPESWKKSEAGAAEATEENAPKTEPEQKAEPGPEAPATTPDQVAPSDKGEVVGETRPGYHYYSSKPPLLPTIIAGILYPFRAVSGVPLDKETLEARSPRNVMEPIEGEPGKFRFKTEKSEDRKPVVWPVYVYYFKPIIILFNVVPYFVFLILYARLLDRHARNDWAWFFSLFAAAWGTFLFSFNQTLNNHTVAAYSAFFALYPLIRIFNDGERRAFYFLMAGFFGGFCACNELPAALFGILLFLLLLVRFPKKTLAYFVPAAAIPCVAFLVTEFLAFGQITPVYEEFGTQSYTYQGSYWNTPLEFDWFNLHPEPKEVYLFHMTLGHHGVYSLTPIFLFSVFGVLRNLFGRGRRLSTTAWLTLVLTVAMFAVYTWNPKASNYGGSTQGLRWLFWLIPFWLVMLPMGVEGGQNRGWVRWLSLVALALSVMTVGYGMRTPWSHPWIVDLMERLNLYHLHR